MPRLILVQAMPDDAGSAGRVAGWPSAAAKVELRVPQAGRQDAS